MLISPAFAQAPSIFGGGDNPLTSFLVPMVLVFVIFYFLMLRPQQKRVKQHQELIKNLRRGDTVITSGGLIGKVVKIVDDNELQVEIGENVKVRLLRSGIADLPAKGEPVKTESK